MMGMGNIYGHLGEETFGRKRHELKKNIELSLE
jgi:hypothetical protein